MLRITYAHYEMDMPPLWRDYLSMVVHDSYDELRDVMHAAGAYDPACQVFGEYVSWRCPVRDGIAEAIQKAVEEFLTLKVGPV